MWNSYIDQVVAINDIYFHCFFNVGWPTSAWCHPSESLLTLTHQLSHTPHTAVLKTSCREITRRVFPGNRQAFVDLSQLTRGNAGTVLSQCLRHCLNTVPALSQSIVLVGLSLQSHYEWMSLFEDSHEHVTIPGFVPRREPATGCTGVLHRVTRSRGS